MKILFAITNNKIVDKIVKYYEKKYKKKVEYTIASDLEECNNLLNDSYYKLVLSEEFIIDHMENKLNDIEFFKCINNIVQNFNRNNIIFIAKNSRKQDDIFLYKIVYSGIYTILTKSIIKEKIVHKCCEYLDKSLTFNDVKLYYNKYNYYDVVNTIIKENELEEIMKMFLSVKDDKNKTDNLFKEIASRYTKEQMDIIVNWIPDKAREYLNSNNELYENIINNSSIKVSVKCDSVLGESSILRFIARFKNLAGNVSIYNYIFDNYISEYSTKQKILIVGNLPNEINEYLQDNELYQNLRLAYDLYKYRFKEKTLDTYVKCPKCNSLWVNKSGLHVMKEKVDPKTGKTYTICDDDATYKCSDCGYKFTVEDKD